MSESKLEITVDVEITRLDRTPRQSILPRLPSKGRWYAAFSAGALNFKTKQKTCGDDGQITWNESFTFTIPAENKPSINITIYQAHEYSNDEKVAIANELNLIELSKSRESATELCRPRSLDKTFGCLMLRVQFHLPRIEFASLGLVTMSDPLLAQLIQVPSISESWQRFLQAFGQAVMLAREIGELNGAAKVAIGAISFAVTIVMKQIERDERASELHEMMTSLLLFFQDVESVQKNHFLCTVLDHLLLQASDCTYFLIQYQKLESFAQRAAAHWSGSTDIILDGFFSTFTTLRAELALGISLQATITAESILNKVNGIYDLQMINELHALKECGWDQHKRCSQCSRSLTLQFINQWIISLESGLFNLVGPRGSGKSAILRMVAETSFEADRLGACVFLTEHTQGNKTATSVMRTVVRSLARANQNLGKRLASALAARPMLCSADASRYGKLLAEVTHDLVLYPPLVVIVDGVHELAEEDYQELSLALCQVASTASQKLRFIIATRLPTSQPSEASVCWEIGRMHCNLLDAPLYHPESFPNFRTEALRIGYSAWMTDLGTLIHQHSQTNGGAQCFSMLYQAIEAKPKFGRFLQLLLSHLCSESEVNATNHFDCVEFLDSVMRVQETISLVKEDILASRSVMFVEAGSDIREAPNDSSSDGKRKDRHYSKFCLGYCVATHGSRVLGFDEFEIITFRCLPRLVETAISSLLPTTEPLIIYRVLLREASNQQNKGPVYARLSQPTDKPLLDGQKFKTNRAEELFFYGLSGYFLDMAPGRSPSEGCEWIILDDGLSSLKEPNIFSSQTKSARVTTPVLTQAILERLAGIWVSWEFNGEGSLRACSRIRGRRTKSRFLEWDSFTDVVYRGTHSELICNGESKGDLRDGDQLELHLVSIWAPYVVMALAMKY